MKTITLESWQAEHLNNLASGETFAWVEAMVPPIKQRDDGTWYWKRYSAANRDILFAGLSGPECYEAVYAVGEVVEADWLVALDRDVQIGDVVEKTEILTILTCTPIEVERITEEQAKRCGHHGGVIESGDEVNGVFIPDDIYASPTEQFEIWRACNIPDHEHAWYIEATKGS